MKLCQLIERLQLPELCLKERLDIASQLRELFGIVIEYARSENKVLKLLIQA
jgi:hypothetical protein